MVRGALRSTTMSISRTWPPAVMALGERRCNTWSAAMPFRSLSLRDQYRTPLALTRSPNTRARFLIIVSMDGSGDPVAAAEEAASSGGLFSERIVVAFWAYAVDKAVATTAAPIANRILIG